ncbi:MAG: transposase [Lentisphaeria bacterium]|nr:transposase [Lentisphaeria bacterium]
MARPLRVEFPGACYHVICRGNFRFPVFAEERDRDLLLKCLVRFAESFHVRVRAYCLMTNHFHGYVQTEEANLGRFMQSFLTSFTIAYNRRHHTSGHVFQGRYKAFLVEDQTSHSSEVSRYVHLNPVRIPSLEGARTEKLQRGIRECRWSSYGAIIGLRRCPKWLKREDVLRGLGRTMRERQGAYAQFVEQALTKGLWDPWEAAVAQTIIGSDSFVDRIRRALTDLAEDVNIRSESGQRRTLQAWCSLAEVKEAVGAAYGCGEKMLLRRRSRNNEPRQVLLYLAGVYCRGRQSLSELGLQLGPVTVAALSRARNVMTQRIRDSAELAGRVGAIEAKLKADKSQIKD